MSILFAEIEKQAKLLTPGERAALAHILIDDLVPSTDDNVEQLWISEATHRYDDYLRGEIKALPGEDVMSRTFGRLK